MLGWAKSIACYIIAISLFMGILPEGNFKKYVKFFTGLVLSLLLITPVMKLFSIDVSMANNYSNEFSKLWDDELEGQEEKNLASLIENTVSSMGYELNQIQYKKSSTGEIVGVTVYMKEKKEMLEFEVPVILVEQIEAIKIEETQSESQTDSEPILALKEVIAVMCEVEVTIIVQ